MNSSRKILGAIGEAVTDVLNVGETPVLLDTDHQNRTHTVYLTKEIGPVYLYDHVIRKLLTAGKDWTFNFVISGAGGDFNTAVALVEAMRRSLAKTAAVVLAEASSSHAIIAVSCDTVSILETGFMMIHRPYLEDQEESVEAATEADKHIRFMYKTLAPIIYESVYSGFLTAVEIDEVLNGDTLWITGYSVNARLKALGKHTFKRVR